ncbi:hypothetical protein GGR54DRAFT_578249 [Hypoxylon sp. NC1633]|nr:hypothetical protein GGR54DRAFT_578249 [Hypoxylon sp. NC1633]
MYASLYVMRRQVWIYVCTYVCCMYIHKIGLGDSAETTTDREHLLYFPLPVMYSVQYSYIHYEVQTPTSHLGALFSETFSFLNIPLVSPSYPRAVSLVFGLSVYIFLMFVCS